MMCAVVVPADGVAGQDGPVWARVAVPFAGGSRGGFFIPDVGDEVVVAFVGAAARCPIVIGSLWNGYDTAPETLGGSGESVDRWTITGKAGTRIAIVEQPASNATISMTTPAGQSGTITDQGGGSITLTHSSQNTITIDATGVTINAPAGQVQITAASEVSYDGGVIHLHAGSRQRMVKHDVSVGGVSLTGADQSKPVLLQINDDEFLKGFLKDLAAIPQPSPGASAASATPLRRTTQLGASPSIPVTLYQPLQRVTHLALARLNCESVGYPRLDPKRVVSAGLVIRRVPLNNGFPNLAGFASPWVRDASGQPWRHRGCAPRP